METRTAVDRLRGLFRQTAQSQEYERIEEDPNDEDVRRPVLIIPDNDKVGEEPFSWFEYSIFVLLGIAMLWAWYEALSSAFRLSANNLIGTCSSQQLRTSKLDFKTTIISSPTSNPPSHLWGV